MLVILWSAFFLSTLDLFFHLFATVEIYLALTVVALVARAMVDWAQMRRDNPAQPVRRLAVHLEPLDWAALAFVVLGALSLSWASLRSTAVHELRVVILEPALLYALLRMMRLERRDVLWLADTLVFTGVAIAVVGLIMFFSGKGVVESENGSHRLISIYGSPNGVGLYLGRCLPFALVYAVLPTGEWRRVYGGVGGALMLLAVLLSQSRGAILLGLPAALIAILLLWRGRRASMPVALAVVGMAVVFIPLSLLLPRLSDLFGDTAFFRENLWYSSLNLIRERPLTGVGLDQFLYWYRSRYLVPEAWAEPNLSIPHNILLNYWVNLGILGVCSGITFQVMFWRTLLRLRRRVSAADPVTFALVLGLAGSMADFLAHGLVDVAFFAVNLAFVFFLSLALVQRLALLAQPLGHGEDG
jgi:O-antigen ligase